MENVCLLL